MDMPKQRLKSAFGAWTFMLTNGGRALTFGYVRGTQILIR